MLTVTATLADLSQNPIPGASLRLSLAGSGSQIPRVPGAAVLAATVNQTHVADANGRVSFPVLGNDAIQPSGTYYTVQVVDAANNVIQTNAYQFTGSAPVDLSSLMPFNPNPVFPPTPGPLSIVAGNFLRVPYGPTLQFATFGFSHVVFGVLLTGSVSASTFAAAPLAGQIVAFLITQDGAGGHAFAYPPNVIDPLTPATYAGAKTFQAFIAADDGNLYPFGVASEN